MKPQKRDFPNLTPAQQKLFDEVNKDIKPTPTKKPKAETDYALTDLGKAVLKEVDKVNQTNPKAKAKPKAKPDGDKGDKSVWKKADWRCKIYSD